MKKKISFMYFLKILFLIPIFPLFLISKWLFKKVSLFFIRLKKKNNFIYSFSSCGKRRINYLPGILIFIILILGVVLPFVFNQFNFQTDVRALSHKQHFFLECKREANTGVKNDICKEKEQKKRLNQIILQTKVPGQSVQVTFKKTLKSDEINGSKKKKLFLIEANINPSLDNKNRYDNFNKNFAFYKVYNNLTQRGGYLFLDREGRDLLRTGQLLWTGKGSAPSWFQFLKQDIKIKRIPQKKLIKKAEIIKSKSNSIFASNKFELSFKESSSDKFKNSVFVRTNEKKELLFVEETPLILQMLTKLGQDDNSSLFDFQDPKVLAKWIKIVDEKKGLSVDEKLKFKTLIKKIHQDKISPLNPNNYEDLAKMVKLGIINHEDIYLKYFHNLIEQKRIAFVIADISQFWIKIRNVLKIYQQQGKYYNKDLLAKLNKLDLKKDYLQVNNEQFSNISILSELNAFLPKIFEDLAYYKTQDSSLASHFISSETDSFKDNKISKSFFFFDNAYSYFSNLVSATKFRNEGFFYEKSARSFLWSLDKSNTSDQFNHYQSIFIFVIVFGVLFVCLLVYFYRFFGFLVSLFTFSFVGFSIIFINLLNAEISFGALLIGLMLIFFGVIWQLWFFSSLKRYTEQKSSLNSILYSNLSIYLRIFNYYFIFFLLGGVLYFINGIGTFSTPLSDSNLITSFFGLGELLILLLFVSFLIHVVSFAVFDVVLFYSFDSQIKKSLIFFAAFEAKKNDRFSTKLSVRLDRLFFTNGINEKFVLFLFLFLTVFITLAFFNKEFLYNSDTSEIWIQKKWNVNPSQNSFREDAIGKNWEDNLFSVTGNLYDQGVKEVQPLQIAQGKDLFYGLKINGSIPENSRDYLLNTNFSLLSHNKSTSVLFYWEFISFLRLFGIILGFLSLFIWMRFGWEYMIFFALTFSVKGILFFILPILFDLKLDGNFFLFAFFFLSLDLILTLKNYLYLSSTLNNRQNIKLHFFPKKTLIPIISFMLFFVLFSIFGLLIEFSWNNVFSFLFLIVFFCFLIFFVFVLNHSLIFKLYFFKKRLYKKLVKYILFVTFKNKDKDQTEDMVAGINE